MAWLPIPDNEDAWGELYERQIVDQDSGALWIVVGNDRDTFAVHPDQLTRPPVVDMLRQVREKGALVKLARIPQRPPGPLH